jgi:DNA-binding CsgD family transcriptional regulator
MGDGTAWRAAAADLYGDLRLSPMLERLVRHSTRLLGAAAGSISLVDPDRQRYGKVAEEGVSCRLGSTFALDEGATGRVLARRRPVVLASYRDVPVGHLAPGHPAGTGAVAAVPIWWRGDVIGANVVFAGRSREFTGPEVDELEALTQVAAVGLVRAGVPYATGPAAPGPYSLTPREQQVLDLLGRGLSDRQLASTLAISPKTVEKHVGAVLRKTGAGSRTAAVLRALELGWLGR